MKGIILAGGKGTRLHPATQAVCKQLLPIYDKPMVYYPLSTLMLAGVRDILIITTPQDQEKFAGLLKDGSQLGIRLKYQKQDSPRGLADAFIVGEDFIQRDNCCLILGDNLLHGPDLSKIVRDIPKTGATIFGYHVSDPQRYGVVELDRIRNGRAKALSIEEKPEHPKSNYAVIGLYFYDNHVSELARGLKPSARGEIEITDLNRAYLRMGKLETRVLGRGFAWLDTGTFDSMVEATDYIRALEKRQGQKIGCIEEVAYRMGFIDERQLKRLAKPLMGSGYGQYLLELIEKK